MTSQRSLYYILLTLKVLTYDNAQRAFVDYTCHTLDDGSLRKIAIMKIFTDNYHPTVTFNISVISRDTLSRRFLTFLIQSEFKYSNVIVS